MKTILNAVASIALLSGAWCSQVIAQDGEDTPTLNPVEIFTCNYLKGKDRTDLDKVITRWNAWTDKNNPTPYDAWVLTPAFTGPEITFDVAWLGTWPSYADMGTSEQIWRDKGADMNAAFFELFSCDQHVSMAVLPMQPRSDLGDSGLVRFMDCAVAEGKNPEQAVEAHSKFSKYMKGKGADTSAWIFFPGMGAGKIDYDYKLVLFDSDYPSLTKSGDIISNAGGWKEAGTTFGGITDCDSARMYHADRVRNGVNP